MWHSTFLSACKNTRIPFYFLILLITVLLSACGGGGERISDSQDTVNNPPDTAPLDTTSPIIYIDGYINGDTIELEAGDSFSAPAATAIDDTDGSVNVDVYSNANTAIPGSYTVDYTCRDSSGNEAQASLRVIVNDTQPPLIEIDGYTDGDTISLEAGEVFSEPLATATDNIDGLVSVNVESDVDTAIPGHYTLYYSATDASGNTAGVVLYVTVSPAEELRVLFIGNSFTFGGGGSGPSVPDVFEALAKASGFQALVVMRAEGGVSYQWHYENSGPNIAAQPWTHVVLQNYSTQPTHIGDIPAHLNYGALLCNLIINNNPDTQILLYETWSRRADHALITGSSTSTSFESTAEMQTELRDNYQALADTLNSENLNLLPVLVSPVGDAWENAGGLLDIDDPDFINLYSVGGYHSNDNGIYLTAAVHFSKIYGINPAGLFTSSDVQVLNLQVSDADAAFFEMIAWDTVQNQ